MANLTGPIGYPQPTSVTVAYATSAPLKIALGTRARDASGNEYVYVNFGAARAIGEVVTYDTDYLTAALGTTATGPIGVVMGTAGSSDLAGWLQIYGYCSYVLAGSAITSGPAMTGATTDGYSVLINATTGTVADVAGWIFATSASTQITTDMSSILGITTAVLNYPFISGIQATS
jgi:hypothetical protein